MDAFVRRVAVDWREAKLQTADYALCTYAAKVTADPHTMTASDLDTLRQHGFSDRAIHDATQVIGYFNYINRVADALGVGYEDFVAEWERPFPASPDSLLQNS